jgi:TonB-linked SusC/RagA family outer membrane protein
MLKRLPGIRKIIFGTLLSHLVTFGFGQDQPLTFASAHSIHFTQKIQTHTLLDLLKLIEKKYGVVFDYNRKALKSKIVTINPNNWKEENLDNLLTRLLSPLELKFEKYNEHSYIIYEKREKTRQGTSHSRSQPEGTLLDTTSASLNANASLPNDASTATYEEIMVSGKVTASENNQGLPGVSIIVKGTTTGTATDSNGNYKIRVPDEKAILVFSFIGYVAEEVPVNARSVINISLLPDIKSLSEVVVIGYGTQEKKDLTGAISSISGQELVRVPTIGVDQALQGRMAGVQVTSNSGDPGSTASVRIRGVGTIGYNDPLFVIDGVPTVGFNLNSINPNDVESIDVLKDASSTAIYGSRAANGVVIVTTKRGKSGKTKFSFDTYHGVQNAWRKIPLLNGSEHATIVNEAIANANTQRTGTLIKPLEAFANPASVPTRADWQDELFKPAGIHDYQLSASGGNDKSTFAFSGSYRNQEGIILNSSFERFTFRLNSDHLITSKLKAGNSLTFSSSQSTNRISNDEWNGVLFNAVIMPPQLPVFLDSISRYAQPEDFGPNYTQYYGSGRNPVRQAVQDDRKDVIQRLLASGYAQFEIIPGLVLRSDIGIDLTTNKFKRYELSFFRDGSINPAILQQSVYDGRFWNWDNTLSFSRNFSNIHSLTAIIGTSALDGYSEGFNAGRVGGFPSDAPVNRFLGLGNPSSATNSSSVGDFSLFSTFARAAYVFKEKYLVTATMRRDGSSKFLGDNKYGVFPSASIGWRISEEAFMKSITFLSDLKIRASWGETGNQEVGSNYPFLTTVAPGGADYLFGNSQNLTQGVAPVARGNQNIKWETVTQEDIGLDVALLDNRIFVTADYYIKETKDMLLQVPIPGLGGRAAAPFVNAGSVRNKGVELAITYRKSEGDFKYSIGFNGSHNTNEVTSLGVGKYLESPFLFRTGVTLTRTAVGQPIGAFYGYQTNGIFQSQEEINAVNALGDPNMPYQADKTAPGDIRYKDIAGAPDEKGNPTGPDGKIDANDRTFIGSGIPKINYGLNFNASYKNFDFSLFLQGVQGVDIINTTRYFTEGVRNDAGNKATSILDRWTPENTNTSVPRLTFDDPNDNSRPSDRFVENGAYMRLKNVQLGYSIPGGLANRIGLSTCRVYVSTQNLFTLTKYEGFDPEVGVNQNNVGNQFRNLEVGVDRGIYPQARVFLVGINLGI